MEITDKNLAKFRQWLAKRGRSDDTATLYICNIKSCAADPRGITHRLVSGALAPNTLRTNLAALRSWAKFTKNAELAEQLGDIRLPPARRVRAKTPLSYDHWRQIVRHLHTCQLRNEAMRHVLLIMALRGLRMGDVLRIRRTEIVRALATGKLIYEGKGRKRLEFSAQPIHAQLEGLAGFKNWEQVRDLLGTGSAKSMSKKVQRAARLTAKKIGLEMNPHKYRHTFATNYLARLHGDPNAIIKLQKYMGWESMATAARYVDSVAQDELDTIGAALVSDVAAD